ncbi:hypothetical protein NB717_003651 [Xanthomonas sacchari]|nr:hypothetical protein [Xanthomonas sacchari]
MHGRRRGAGHPGWLPRAPSDRTPGCGAGACRAGRVRAQRPATRRARARAAGTGTAAGQAGRRGRRAGQGRVPGDDEPRDPHPAQRHHPDAGTDRARPARPGPARDAARGQHLLAATAAHRRRHPGLLQAGSEPAGAGDHHLQPARTARRRAGADAARGRGQGPAHGAATGRGGTPAGARRPGAPAPGAEQPARQRGQVHRARRHRPGRAPARRDPGTAPAALRGARHRHRHQRRAPGAPVPGLHPGRRLHHPPVRRHRAGPDHLQAHRRADGRAHRRGVAAGPGRHVLVRDPAAEGDRRPAAESGRPAAAACAAGRRRPAPAAAPERAAAELGRAGEQGRFDPGGAGAAARQRQWR